MEAWPDQVKLSCVHWFISASGVFIYVFSSFSADVDEDGFRFKCVSLKWIRSKNNKFLILNDSNEFQAQNLSTDEQEHHPGEAQ